MGQTGILGIFEQYVLLAVLRLDGEAYAVPVRRVIEEHIGRTVSRGAVYTTLDRLEAKGLLTSHFGPSSPTPGGKARRLYAVSTEGRGALEDSREAIQSLWRGVEGVTSEA